MYIKGIVNDFSLKKNNTFGVDALAKYFLSITDIDLLGDAFVNSNLYNNNFLILGGGSNILFTKDFEGLVLNINLKDISVINETDDNVWVKAGAGVVWHDLVSYCVENGYCGIENLALIPGTVGGAPVHNIGAYGAEVGDVIYAVDTFDVLTSKFVTFDNKSAQFGYRTSLFKDNPNNYVILSVTIKLSKTPVINLSYESLIKAFNKDLIGDNYEVSIYDVYKLVIKLRSSVLPDYKMFGNAGSFFKNPVLDLEVADNLSEKFPKIPLYQIGPRKLKTSAAWLIEKCGWKGLRRGNVGVYDKHALILINYGGGSGKEVFQLATDIKDSVQQKYGILLEEEVNII